MKTLSLALVAIAPAMSLQACSDLSVPLPPRVRPPEMSTCGAVDLQNLVGRPVSTLERTIVERARVIRPGQAVTMDFNAARLNLELDAEDRVLRLWCG